MRTNKPESEIKRSIFDYLKVQPNVFCWINHTTGVPIGRTGKFRFNYNRGIADICGVKRGKAFAFEVKTPKLQSKLSPNQKEWLESFDRAGGYACVVRRLDDAMEAFEEI